MISPWLIVAIVFTAAMTIEPIRDFLFGSLDEFEDDPQEGRGATVTKRGSLEHIPVIYGQRRTGGILNFKGVEGTIKNENLWQEFILSEGECDSLVDVYIDGESYTDPKFFGVIGVWFYAGSDSQTADANLVAKFPDYDSNDRGRGLCKIVVQIVFDEEKMTREPKLEFEIKGKKVLDPRISSTVWSANPALILYDYLVSPRYGAGYKLSASALQTSDFNSAATYCETQINEHSGTSNTINIYEIHALIDTGIPVRENILKILNAFNAHLINEGNVYRLTVEKDDASVLSLDSDKIIENSVTYAFNDIKDRFNEIVVSYPNKEKEYLDDQIIFSDATLLSQDNNIKSQKRIKMYLDTSYYRTLHFAKIVVKKSRQGIAVGLTATEEAAILLPGDIVELSLLEPGFLNKKFRVLKTKEMAGGNVGLNLLEHEPSVYDRTIPVAAPTPPDTYLPSPYVVEQMAIPSAFSGDSYVILASSGDLIPRVLVTWTPLNNIYITHYQIQWKLNADSNWSDATPALGQSANRQFIVGPNDSDTIDIRVRAVNARGVTGEWSQTLSHIVIGTTGVPPDVSTFIVTSQSDGTRVAQFGIDSPPVDLAGYKIRYSNDNTETWDDMDPLNDGLLTTSPYEFNLLSEGDWLFAIKAFDRGGRESNNALYVSTSLPAPRIGSILYTEAFGSGWNGTKTNCYVDESNNNLVADTTTTWDDLTSTWDDYDETWYFDTVTTFTYETLPIDLGTPLLFTADVRAVANAGTTVTIEEAHSDDGSTYSSWVSADTAGDIEARFIKFKFTVTNASAPGRLLSARVFLGGDTIVDTFTLLDTGTLSPVSGEGVRIPIRSAFKKITDVNVSLHSVGAGYTWEVIDLDAVNGPHIKIWDSTGTIDNSVTISAQVLGV